MIPQTIENANGTTVVLKSAPHRTSYFSCPEGVIYFVLPDGRTNCKLGTLYVDADKREVTVLGEAVEGRNEVPVLLEADLNTSLLEFTQLAGKSFNEARKFLRVIDQWYTFQDESLAHGLRNLEDAIDLYVAYRVEKPVALSNVILPEFADSYEFELVDPTDQTFKRLEDIHKAILGYSPLEK